LFFKGRRITFSMECFLAETELEMNFGGNKDDFFELAKFVKNTSPIEFDFHSGDTIYMTFQDSAIRIFDLFIDSTYYIRPGIKSDFKIDEDGCLEFIHSDTIKVCNNNWQIIFYGHYKNQKINGLLNYYGWTRKDFDRLVENVQKINCLGFENNKNGFGLSYKIVSYYNDRILHCLRHSDGYFDYLYTAQPDNFYLQNSLNKLEDNYYGIKHWNF